MILPPGTILQIMYVKERIHNLLPGTFLEVGCGVGYLSNVLLNYGWKGTGVDLNPEALKANAENNKHYMQRKLYAIKNADFFTDKSLKKGHFDVIISSMVLEHFDEDMEGKYFTRCRSLLKKGGRLILLLPASSKHWGIEDEIAGHFRRYDKERIIKLAQENKLKVQCISGLTFPISNLLLPLSNYLVRKHESRKMSLTAQEKTIQSGYRNVRGKNVFSGYFKLILNEYFLYPFHLIQKIFRNRKDCLVLYSELSLPS